MGLASQVQFGAVSALVTLLVVGGVGAAWRSASLRGLPRRDLLLLGAVLLLGLALRLYATPFVASTEVESAQGHGILGAHRWAAGWSAVLHALFLFAPGTVATIAKLNVVVSLATVVALFVLVDSYLEDRFAAFAAAAVLALHPVAVRYAASDSSGVLQTFCLVAGAAFLARWGRHGGRGRLFAGVGWLVLAANVRYEAVVYLLAGLLIVVGAGGWSRRARWREVLVAGGAGVAFLLYPAGRALLDASGGVFELSPLGWIGAFVLSRHSPTAVVAVAFLGLGAAVLARFREAVALLLALLVVSLPGYFFSKECADFCHRFALPQVALWAAFAGYGCGAAGRLLRRATVGRRAAGAGGAGGAAGALPLADAAAVLALVAAAAVPHLGYLRTMWTHALEHDWVVAQLRALPDGCLLVGPDSDRESRGLRFSAHLSMEAGRRHRWVRADDPDLLAGHLAPCTVFYRATTCFAYESVLEPQNPDWTGAERPVCRRLGERFRLEPLAETSFPSRSYTCEAHTVDPIPVGFYRLRPRGAPAAAEAAP